MAGATLLATVSKPSLGGSQRCASVDSHPIGFAVPLSRQTGTFFPDGENRMSFATQSEKGIFIHAWWRSGSTYVWSKLRRNQALCCYYEPLHEKIADITVKTIMESPEPERSLFLRHPIQNANYFAEYQEFLGSNTRFSDDLSYNRFLLATNQEDPKLLRYLGTLIDAAFLSNRRPILCFCRSQMRVAWMRKHFGGIHIAQIRNPIDQWASFNVEPYFPRKTLMIALKLRNQHPLSFVHIENFDRFAKALEKRPSLPVENIVDFFLTKDDIFAVFLIIWVASALQAISYSDYILDIDLLSKDTDYRFSTTHWFETVGCPTEFADCNSPSAGGSIAPEIAEAFEKAVDAIRSNASQLVITDPSVVRKQFLSLSPVAQRLLDAAVVALD